MNYIAPWWLPGGNLQTLWPAVVSPNGIADLPVYRRERWSTPDADFIDVDWVPAVSQSTLLVLFHGLEGSSSSHYAQAFAEYSRRNAMAFAVPHFRGCSGELNWAPRAYHCGDYEEVDWILQRFRDVHTGPIVVVGISLGGNALLRWAQEQGRQAARVVSAIAAVSSPIDLTASGLAIGRGFNRWVYTRMFLHSMKPKALKKLEQHPGLFDRDALVSAGDLYAFDNAFTAPLHGFKSTEDYWRRASAKPRLSDIDVPTLLVNARNDPFIPASCLPQQSQVGQFVTMWYPAQGGHAGFPWGRQKGSVGAVPEAVGGWLMRMTGGAPHSGYG